MPEKKTDRSHELCFTWFVTDKYIREVLLIAGWKMPRIDQMLIELCGIRRRDGRRRFAHHVVDQGQRAGLTGSSITFYAASEILLQAPQFPEQSMKWYRPVFTLLDRFPQSLSEFDKRMTQALARVELARMSCQHLREGMLGKRTPSLFLPFLLNDLELTDWYGKRVQRLADAQHCVFDRLNVIALLFSEAIISRQYSIAGELRQVGEQCLAGVSESSLLDRKYRQEFLKVFRTRILNGEERILDWAKRNQVAVNDFVGSPLLTRREAAEYQESRERALALNPMHGEIARSRGIRVGEPRHFLRELSQFRRQLAESSALVGRVLYPDR